jgi:hypothetical protein
VSDYLEGFKDPLQALLKLLDDGNIPHVLIGEGWPYLSSRNLVSPQISMSWLTWTAKGAFRA